LQNEKNRCGTGFSLFENRFQTESTGWPEQCQQTVTPCHPGDASRPVPRLSPPRKPFQQHPRSWALHQRFLNFRACSSSGRLGFSLRYINTREVPGMNDFRCGDGPTGRWRRRARSERARPKIGGSQQTDLSALDGSVGTEQGSRRAPRIQIGPLDKEMGTGLAPSLPPVVPKSGRAAIGGSLQAFPDLLRPFPGPSRPVLEWKPAGLCPSPHGQRQSVRPVRPKRPPRSSQDSPTQPGLSSWAWWLRQSSSLGEGIHLRWPYPCPDLVGKGGCVTPRDPGWKAGMTAEGFG